MTRWWRTAVWASFPWHHTLNPLLHPSTEAELQSTLCHSLLIRINIPQNIGHWIDPRLHWDRQTQNRHELHVYIGSVGPWPVHIMWTSKHVTPTFAQLGALSNLFWDACLVDPVLWFVWFYGYFWICPEILCMITKNITMDVLFVPLSMYVGRKQFKWGAWIWYIYILVVVFICSIFSSLCLYFSEEWQCVFPAVCLHSAP